MSTDIYITNGSSSTTGHLDYSGNVPSSYLQSASLTKPSVQISPQLYFKFVKKNLGTLEKFKFERRIKKLEAAFEKAVENGQEVLADKMLNACVREAKESFIYAKGFKLFIEKQTLDKYKNKIRDGHISDTRFDQYTRVIPKDVLKSKEKAKGLFDGYVIYHYWNEKAQEDVKSMSKEEKAAMRDPILFGVIKESDRLYFIDDWEDEYCDLTFDEIVDVIGDDSVGELTNKPDLREAYSD